MITQHKYTVIVTWTGNNGNGTKDYKTYLRDHTIFAEGKYDTIKASSDPSFLGDIANYNPEELFLSSISSCHMLWYLHLCATNNIVVTQYNDNATGIMEETKNGSGRFIEVTLHPQVRITDSKMIEKANTLHEEANRMCFIANSCNFKITHKPTTQVS